MVNLKGAWRYKWTFSCCIVPRSALGHRGIKKIEMAIVAAWSKPCPFYMYVIINIVHKWKGSGLLLSAKTIILLF